MRPKKNKKGKKAITNAQASLGFTRPHHFFLGQQERRHGRILQTVSAKCCLEALHHRRESRNTYRILRTKVFFFEEKPASRWAECSTIVLQYVISYD